MVESGQVDICLEVSMNSSHIDIPSEGRLNKLFHIFSHLRKCHNPEMIFDPSDPVIDESKYQQRGWTSSEFGNGEVKQELPCNIPQSIGIGVTVRLKVNAEYPGDIVTRRLRARFLVYINSALVVLFSKNKIV